MQRGQYEYLAKGIKKLPVLPATSLRIINVVNDPDISVEALVDVLSTSPSLVARLLSLANSAFFAQPTEITDLKRAIIQVLGVNLVKSLSLSIALNAQLDVAQCPAFSAEQHWTEAIHLAILMQKVIRKVPNAPCDPTTAYTTGLLNNIGRLVAVFLFPDKMQELYTRCIETDLPIDAEINREFGCFHHQLGYIVFKKWGLPVVYQNVLRNFNHIESAGSEGSLILVIRFCQKINTSMLSHQSYHLSAYQEFLQELQLSEMQLQTVVDEILGDRENIDELASIICG